MSIYVWETSAQEPECKVPASMKFAIGGAAGIVSQIVTHPMDVIRLQMQVTNTTMGQTVKHITEKGFSGFYVGLTAAFLRQLTYTTGRLGIYTTLFDYCTEHFGRLNYFSMLGIGMISGTVGALIGTPTEVVLVRMVGDIKLPPEKRRNYKNVIAAFADITKNEGVKTLWRGAIPTMGRAAVINGVQLGTYSRTKLLLIDSGHFHDNLLTQFIAANVSGFGAAFTSLPLDVAKTRIQNWPDKTKPPNMIKVIFTVARTTGVASLWRGFVPFYSKAGPATIIIMLFVDQAQSLYRKHCPFK